MPGRAVAQFPVDAGLCFLGRGHCTPARYRLQVRPPSPGAVGFDLLLSPWTGAVVPHVGGPSQARGHNLGVGPWAGAVRGIILLALPALALLGDAVQDGSEALVRRHPEAGHQRVVEVQEEAELLRPWYERCDAQCRVVSV